MQITRKWYAGVMAVLICSGLAAAGFVQYTGTHYGKHISIGGAVHYSSVYAGSFTVDFYPDSTAAIGDVQEYYAFCADPSTTGTQGHLAGLLDADLFSLMLAGTNPASDAGTKAAWLYTMFAQETITPTISNPKVYAAALQAAIWEVLIEDPANGYTTVQTTGADFYVGSAYSNVIAQADVFLQSLQNDYDSEDVPTEDRYIINQHPCKDYQHFLIPEPATLVLLATGVALLLRRRRGARQP